jgi:hypothetical protein
MRRLCHYLHTGTYQIQFVPILILIDKGGRVLEVSVQLWISELRPALPHCVTRTYMHCILAMRTSFRQ